MLGSSDRVARTLARLNPKVAQLEIGYGGQAEFSPADIAAAIGLCDSGLAALGLWLYCDSIPARQALLARYLQLVDDRAEQEDWGRHLPEAKMTATKRSLVQGAMQELRNGSQCSGCGGTGWGIENGKPAECSVCQGSGYASISARQRARLCRMPWESFRRTWHERYLWLVTHLHREHGAFLGQFQRRLRG